MSKTSAAVATGHGGVFFLQPGIASVFRLALATLALSALSALTLTTDTQAETLTAAGDAHTRAVGLVVCMKNLDGRRYSARGTGTVVGNLSTVLTAAHIFATDSRRSPGRVYFEPADCMFQQFDAEGELMHETRFSDGLFGEYRHNLGLPTQDWAVLRTQTVLPDTSAALPFDATAFDSLDEKRELPVAVLSFHADWAAFRQRRPRVRIPRYTEGRMFEVDYSGFRRLAHTAQTERMSSGAAVVHLQANDGGFVVGVHRSAARLGDFNLAVPVAAELEAALIRFSQDGN